VAPEYLMKEIKSTSVSGFQCQQSMPGSNKRVFDVVSVDGIGMYQEKRDYFKAFRNKSVHTCLVKVLIFKWLYAAISTENDVAFCKRLITEYGVAAIPFQLL
jgi:methionine aminotransferase